MTADDQAAGTDLAEAERRVTELAGWLRLISAPGRTGKVTLEREDAAALVAMVEEYDRRGTELALLESVLNNLTLALEKSLNERDAAWAAEGQMRDERSALVARLAAVRALADEALSNPALPHPFAAKVREVLDGPVEALEPTMKRRTDACSCSGTENPPRPAEMDPSCTDHGIVAEGPVSAGPAEAPAINDAFGTTCAECGEAITDEQPSIGESHDGPLHEGCGEPCVCDTEFTCLAHDHDDEPVSAGPSEAAGPHPSAASVGDVVSGAQARKHLPDGTLLQQHLDSLGDVGPVYTLGADREGLRPEHRGITEADYRIVSLPTSESLADPGEDFDELPTTLAEAIAQIEREATADSILQPGAAYALGTLGVVAGAGPGCTAADLAENILRLAGSVSTTPAEPARQSEGPGRGFPRVDGRCPACGWASLFLAVGEHITCARLDCPDPCAADELLARGGPGAPADVSTTPDPAAILRAAAAGRREYAGNAPAEQADVLDLQATTLDQAAEIVGGDYGALYGWLPSWRWTAGMETRLWSGDPLTWADVAALAGSGREDREDPS
jgi:hypothetical protein